MLGHFRTYDNLAFRRDSSSSKRRQQQQHHQTEPTETDLDEVDLDEESFRSDLERPDPNDDEEAATETDGADSFESVPSRITMEGATPPPPPPAFGQSMSHRKRYEHLMKEANRRASLQLMQAPPQQQQAVINRSRYEWQAVEPSPRQRLADSAMRIRN